MALKSSNLLTDERSRQIKHTQQFLIDLESDPDENEGFVSMQEEQVDRNIEALVMFKQRLEFIEEERPLTPI